MPASKDPEKYRRLSAPRSADETNKALEAFFEEMGTVREKHGIPNVVLVASVMVQYADGNVGEAVTMSSYGDSLKIVPLLAYGLGQARAEDREMVAKLIAGEGKGKAI
jgi:hypothetical protein